MANGNDALIRRGRACVRLIEAVDVLLSGERRADPAQRTAGMGDQAALRAARDLAVRRLRMLVQDADPSVTAEILAASDKIHGSVQDVWLN